MNSAFHVINFHLTEKCNYQCVYCFAKFKDEFELGLDDWKKAVDRIQSYFINHSIQNGRINLAGGEPLLIKFLDELIDYIASKGIKVSIITNGSMLTRAKLYRWSGKVDMLGVSIDSLNKETNIKIGRHQSEKMIDINQITGLLSYASELGIKIKVNTVVSKLNINEDLSYLYKSIQFDRIKLLQIRINENCNESASHLEITKDEYHRYTSKVKSTPKVIIEPEDDIESSYVIIDPQGNMIANSNHNHQKVGSIFNESIENLIKKSNLVYETFSKRYRQEQKGR